MAVILKLLVRLAISLVFLLCLFGLISRAFVVNGNKGAIHTNPNHRWDKVEAVSIEKVISADIPSPTLDKVSFPEFSYHDAWPEAEDEPEVVITKFGEAPMLADLDTMPDNWRKHYPESLEPVEQRLPRNPAVVRGPDGIGQYGGVWNRVSKDAFAWDRMIMYETFIRNDPAGQPQAGVAYRWETKNNNREFTFYMRKGHRWSDGHPFTSHDIAWICNDLIGSPYWLNKPNWMQATDGSAALYVDDILDWQGLAETILKELNSDGPTPGKQLFVTPTPNPAFTDETEKVLEQQKCERLIANQKRIKPILKEVASLQPGSIPDEETRNLMISLLNRVLKNRNYYDATAWQDVDMHSDIEQLEAIGITRLNKDQLQEWRFYMERNSMAQQAEQLRDMKYKVRRVMRLNIMAFRAAYRDYVKKPMQKRVKVEPVADENGDDSHVIRFTFEKPSSFFLEKTRTFMFYRGLFVIAPHFVKNFHPDGSNRLEVVDIYDWPGLYAEMTKVDEENYPTPAKRMWQMMDDKLRQEIADNPPTAESSGEYKQRIIDAINDVLAGREYYQKDVWEGVDFNSELARLLQREGGIDEISNRPDEYRRLSELEFRADYLKRVHEDGIESLDDDDVYQFNKMMFRAALDDPDNELGSGIVACNREQALNYKTKNAPKPYDSWLQKMHALRRNPYHPIENPHMPTLKAWRIVTERIDRESIAIRNPYYYRVDELGNQLPYLDAVQTTIEADREARMLKIRSGNVDFQCDGIEFSDYTMLKQNEDRGNYETRLWAHDSCGEILLYSQFKHEDPFYSKLQTDPRFRKALSSAVNRQEIIDVVYSGLGEPIQYSIPKGSPYYSEKLAKAYVKYDVDLANRLLDEMGLNKRAADGTRLAPVPGAKGEYKPLIFVVYTDEKSVPIQAIEMVCNYWQEIGVNAHMKLSSKLDYLSNIGLLDAAARGGGGSYFGPLQAGVFAPTHPAEAPQWGNWVQYIRSDGQAGEEPPDWVMQREIQWQKIINAPNDEAKYEAWQELMDDNAEMLPVIGILNSPGKVVVVRKDFKNVPKLSMVGGIPNAPGNTCPEVFYIDSE